jgi:hypothetical protein
LQSPESLGEFLILNFSRSFLPLKGKVSIQAIKFFLFGFKLTFSLNLFVERVNLLALDAGPCC